MAVYKDVTPYSIAGNRGGLVFQLNDGSLICLGDSAGGTRGIRKSTDNGQNWTLKQAYTSNSFTSRLHFIDSRGNIFAGNIADLLHGVIYRSTDNGETWSVVCTSEGSGWWRMCEDPSGNLYASEYSQGNRDANELYAYNIWKSSDGGANWTKFYTAPQQSLPGALDGIRHIHHVSCDRQGNLFMGMGDPTFAIPATYAYRLNNDGTLGTLMSTDANGYISFAQDSTGKRYFGGDQTPEKVYTYDINTSTQSVLLQLSTYYSSYFSTGVFDIVVGADDVVYAVTNGLGGVKPSVVVASADQGATWTLLKYNNDLVGAAFLTFNRNAPNPRLYIGRSESASAVFMSIPDFKKGEILGPRVVVR